jgi:hypothetical protein
LGKCQPKSAPNDVPIENIFCQILGKIMLPFPSVETIIFKNFGCINLSFLVSFLVSFLAHSDRKIDLFPSENMKNQNLPNQEFQGTYQYPIVFGDLNQKNYGVVEKTVRTFLY